MLLSKETTAGRCKLEEQHADLGWACLGCGEWVGEIGPRGDSSTPHSNPDSSALFLFPGNGG